MIKVESIEKIENYKLTCRFNNNTFKILNVLPLIEHHQSLKGVEKLLDSDTFGKVRIGQMGELLWRKIITTNHNREEVVL